MAPLRFQLTMKIHAVQMLTTRLQVKHPPRILPAMFENWDLLLMPRHAAAFNMAVDEALLRTAASRARPLLRIYAWEGQPVTFGYFQKFPADLNLTGPIIRRPTGGGIVYHGDDIDTTYTVVVPPGHALHTMKTGEAYCALHKAVAAALALSVPLYAVAAAQKGQYQCFQNPVAGDVVDNGQKLAGGAQRRGKSGMLHQGSIAKTIRAEQLTQGFRQVLLANFAPYQLTAEETSLAAQLTTEKYATEAWNKKLA